MYNDRHHAPIEAGNNVIKRNQKHQRLVVSFLLGCLLFNYPLLALFNKSGAVFGVPILYAYLFIAWALLIGLLAIILRASR